MQYHIIMMGPPTYAPPRSLHPDKLKIVKAEFDHMLEPSIIQPIGGFLAHGAYEGSLRLAAMW